jgi:hypothetical protein
VKTKGPIKNKKFQDDLSDVNTAENPTSNKIQGGGDDQEHMTFEGNDEDRDLTPIVYQEPIEKDDDDLSHDESILQSNQSGLTPGSMVSQ